ncbi:MAG: hypothetical protein KC502_12410 [Myxococcales bacterium]|nr:hypothetical protein [Myxococcales bacterium]
MSIHRRILVVVSTVLSLTVLSFSATAQIVITYPEHGDAVQLRVTTTPPPDPKPQNPTMIVEGEVVWSGKGVPNVQVLGVTVAPGAFQKTQTGWFFRHVWTVPIQPGIGGTWDAGFPFLQNYISRDIIVLPILAELLNEKGTAVTHRDRIVVLETTNYGADPRHVGSVGQPIASQITDDGAVSLSDLHLTTLPWPDAKTFAQRVTTHAKAQADESITPNDLCVSMHSYHPLVGVKAFTDLRSAAVGAYLAYEGCKATAESVPIIGGALLATCEAMCVRKMPEDHHFDVCVGRLKATLRNVTTGDVERSDIRFRGEFANGPSHGDVGVQVRIGEIDALVRVKLSDISFRWRGSKLCQKAFTKKIKGKALNGATVGPWRTCDNSKLWADHADTAPRKNQKDSRIGFNLSSTGCGVGPHFNHSPQCMSVRRSHRVPFKLHKPSSQVTGTCATVWIADKAHKAVKQLTGAIENSIAEAWYQGGKSHGQATALDLLFRPLELTNRPFNDHKLTANFAQINTYWSSEGLISRYNTGATAVPFPFLPALLGIFYQPAIDPTPYLDGKGYDIGHVVSTPVLNQVLKARSGRKLMNFTEDLSGTSWLFPAPAKTTTSTPLASISVGSKVIDEGYKDELAKEAMKELLAWMDKGDFRLVVRRSLAPFTAMASEFCASNQFCPVRYEAGQFEWTLWHKDEVVMRAYIDFRQANLTLGFQATPTPTNGFLQVGLPESIWTATVIESQLPGCPMATRKDEQACERVFEAQLAKVAQSLMRERMREALMQLPAPDWYDANGKASKVLTVKQAGVQQIGQNIILFGKLK